MNQQERDALRAKHHVGQNEADDQCQGCFTIPYPCDVVKVLDAWDKVTPTEATSSECDHEWTNKAGAGYRATPVAICVKCYAEKTYCAKCGEKL